MFLLLHAAAASEGLIRKSKYILQHIMLPKKKKRKRNILSFVLSETCALLLNVRLGERPSRALPLVICYLWLLLAGSSPLRPTVL